MVGIGFKKATARSGKTVEKWKIILNLKEILTDTESVSLFPEMGIDATLFCLDKYYNHIDNNRIINKFQQNGRKILRNHS